jgi:hypothetical protein
MANQLTSEQQMLQDSVARIVREQGRFEQWQHSTASAEAFDRNVWQQMAVLPQRSPKQGLCRNSADGSVGIPLPKAS